MILIPPEKYVEWITPYMDWGKLVINDLIKIIFLLYIWVIKASQTYHSLYVKSCSTYFTSLLVNADDIVSVVIFMEEIKFVKQFHDQQFKIKLFHTH